MPRSFLVMHIFTLVSLVFFAFANPLYGADFQEASPPPELGETLTSYRTKQQILDEAIRESEAYELKKNPQIKIIKKKGDTSGIDSAYMDADSSGQLLTPKRALKTQEYFYMNLKGSKFDVYKDTLMYMTIVDSQNVAWPIAKAEVLNNSFSVKITDDNKLIVRHEGAGGQLAKLKVYLKNDVEPLSFVLLQKNSMHNYDELKVIKISKKSPLNTSKEEAGLTNMVKTAKARNSFRDISFKEQQEPKLEVKKEVVIHNPFGKTKAYVVNSQIRPEDLSEVTQILEEAYVSAK